MSEGTVLQLREPTGMNQIDLQGRRAVITGGARGIGYAIAERYLRSGASVALWDVDQAQMDAATASLSSFAPSGQQVIAEVADVTNEASIVHALEATVSRLGGVDILVNNAGITGRNATTWEYPVEEFRRVLEIDLVGVFLVSRAVVPHLIENGWGRIVNIASMAAKEGNAMAPAYSAAKAGVLGLTKSMGKELVKTGVLVNAVCPAAAQTELFQQMKPEFTEFLLSKIPMGRFVQVDEIAALVAWLSSNDCSFSTGAAFDISGGRATY